MINEDYDGRDWVWYGMLLEDWHEDGMAIDLGSCIKSGRCSFFY